MMYYPPEKKFDVDEIVNQKDWPSSLDSLKKKKSKRKFSRKMTYGIYIFIFIILISSGYMIYEANSNFDKMTGGKNSVVKSLIMMLPFGDNFFQILPTEDETSIIEKLKNNELERLNILLLGIRGVGDPNGGLLTDTIIVVSIKPQTGELALISIPRDLYIDIPHRDYENKINEVYSTGVIDENWQRGLKYSKEAVAQVTGLDIHYATSVDFKAFKEIVDTLGGVTITLSAPFMETNQFEEGIIDLPAGTQNIDGDTALLFARARFSSSDFDRSKRQQQLLIGVKEKALRLGVISNPVKVVSILNSLGNHVKIDAELWELQELISVINKMDTSNTKRMVFDTSKEGLLYASRDLKGSYILLPEGENFDAINNICRDIFN
ncbi:MAG: LCP family protein [Candidatus Pacebacteria bacterium]|nr:LCP family protein [Candidatus Paceibacterota bacterium]